jgi:hypothetical protein
MTCSWNDRVFDNGLSVLDTEVNKIVLCSAIPTTFTQANVTYMLAYKTSYDVGAPADRGAGGREVTCPAVSGGAIDANGTATHYALIDTVNQRLLAAQALSAPVVLATGNTWSCAAFKQGIPDPT